MSNSQFTSPHTISTNASLAAMRGAVGRASIALRMGKASAEDVEAARAAYYAAYLEDHVAAIVAKAPPLTPAQRDRIATLLRGEAHA